jgi:TRAP-type uncharacterized transport system substrate-binding protein
MASAVAGCIVVSNALAPNPVSLTTGIPGGVYHPVGNAIYRMYNLEGEHPAMPCVAVSSDGSVENKHPTCRERRLSIWPFADRRRVGRL